MIQLNSHTSRCTIDPQGAWVESLEHKDTPILFPKTAIEYPEGAKSRGGMHVCVPNFGPGGESGLPQHGFGRTSTWTVVTESDGFVSLELRGEGDYADLKSTLTYAISDTSFTATLHLENTGTRLLRVAPAFHPYFQIEASEDSVVVGDTLYSLSELAGTVFVSAETLALHTKKRSLRLDQENLGTWAIWTDEMGKYVCVEPTHGGYRFLDEPQSDEQLRPYHGMMYTFTIAWE